MKKILLATLCFLSAQNLSSSQYDPVRTQQLQIICNGMRDTVYAENRTTILDLVKNGADPNARRRYDGEPLLNRTVMSDDLELTQLCLAKGADPNPMHHSLPTQYAKQVPILQCLIENKANIHYQEADGANLLHNAAINGGSPELITFLCNAGVNTKQQNDRQYSPYHSLLNMICFHKNGVESASVLLWYDTDHESENHNKQTPLDTVKKEWPGLLPTMQILPTIVSAIKAQHTVKYEKKLAKHISADLARLVMTYIAPSWGQRCWPQISDSIGKQIGQRQVIEQQPDDGSCAIS